MKKTLVMVLVMFFALIAGVVLGLFCPPTEARADSQITFADPRLEQAVREALGISKTEPITRQMAQTLTFLDASSRGIEKLDGLEYLTNLTDLNLANNKVQVIIPISALSKLVRLSLWQNFIHDLSSLSSNTGLTWLDLGANFIENIETLAELNNLQWLNLADNFISDITPLANLANLRWLNIMDNLIDNISSLAENPNLLWLNNLPWSGGSQASFLDQIITLYNRNQERINDWQRLVNGFADLPHLRELPIVPFWQGGNLIENLAIWNDYWQTRLRLWQNAISTFGDRPWWWVATSAEGSMPEAVSVMDSGGALGGERGAELEAFWARMSEKLGSWPIFKNQPWSSYQPQAGYLRKIWESYLSKRGLNNRGTNNDEADDPGDDDDGDGGDGDDNSCY